MASNGFQQSAYSRYSTNSSLPNDVDIGNDIIKTGNIFLSDPKKHEDLKCMLESNKDGLKLEAMKRIISMVAKGKDCGDLFPSVVKNVVSKNAEVKKLVYAYLTRYAEEQQELALLSISTFQRALKDPNQLIRGSALRVLSSIRVPMIVPIMMLAIKESVMDMSPYVRKIAANAIPKMYSLDVSTKDQLIEVIEKLLADKTTLVAGSAIQAFEEVCPERFDLIHKHYRKLCSLLIDVEEWGQIVIINMLTRYARTQFIDPNQIDLIEDKKSFYSEEENSSDSSTSSDDSDDGDEEAKKDKKKSKKTKNSEINKVKTKSKSMDPDHRLLLNSAKPLLQSRNSAVVMSVVQLYYHCAPSVEMNVVIRALIRLLKSNKEVQYVVLNNIATMSTCRPELLLNYLKSFYVYSKDSTQVKLLKLEILTNLANESNISVILRELQSYVGSTDQEFVKATIQSIGRCASNISEVSDSCLAGLVQLISRKDENIVAEAVVVIRKLLQMQTSDHKDIIVSLAILMDSINIAMAKASIIWLIGEYCDRVPTLGPDVLRKAAKTFVDEKDIVKLQTLNLASKLYITNPKQTHLLVQYVLNLAKYDLNYDIRDRARFIRALLFPPVINDSCATTNENGQNGSSTNTFFLSKRVKKIFLATKPAPLLESNFKDRPQYQLSSMSQILNLRVPGYKELPDWPLEAPDPSVRHVPEPNPNEYSPSTHGTGGSLLASSNDKKASKKKGTKKKNDSFYSEESDEDDDEEEEEDDEDSDEEEDESEEDDEDEESSEEESDEAEVKPKEIKNTVSINKASDVSNKNIKTVNNKSTKEESTESEAESESDDDDEDDEDDDDSESSSSIEVPVKKIEEPTIKKSTKSSTTSKKTKVPEVDLLLDFGDAPTSDSGTKSTVNVGFNFNVLEPSVLDSPIQQDLVLKTNQSNQQIEYIPNDLNPYSCDIIPKYSNKFVCATAQFPRSLVDSTKQLVSISLQLTNISSETIHSIVVQSGNTSSSFNSNINTNNNDLPQSPTTPPSTPTSLPALEMFTNIDTLLPSKSVSINLGINFHDSIQPIPLKLLFNTTSSHNNSPEETMKNIEQHQCIDMKIRAPIGELIQPISMTEKEFISYQKNLRGMNESNTTIALSSDKNTQHLNNREFQKQLIRTIYNNANITTVSTKVHRNNNDDDLKLLLQFAGISISKKLPCLIELNVISTKVHLKVNSEQVTLANQLCRDLESALKKLINNL